MSEYYDMEGDPITMEEWVAAFRDNRMYRTKVGGDVEVSTVYLGLDHPYDGGPPLIFETLVFGGAFDQHGDRYSTKEAAEAGHEAWCEKVRAMQRATSG